MSAQQTSSDLIPQVRIQELEALAQTSPELAKQVIEVIQERARVRSLIERRQQFVQVLGMASGLVVALVFGYWSYALLAKGYTIGGSVLGTADLAALVTAFIAGGRRSA